MGAPTPRKDVLLIGFGAVGAVFSMILQNSSKVNVTVVARSNYDLVCNEGVNFKSLKFGEIQRWKPHRVVKSVAAAADRPYSHVFVATKCTPDVVKTSKILAPLISAPYAVRFPQPTYVLLQNGLNVEKDLYEALSAFAPSARIISTALYIMANLLGPNSVQHNDMDRVVMGVYRHKNMTTTLNTPEEQAALEELADIFVSGGGTAEIVPEIQRRKYAKNALNVTFSGVCSLTRSPFTAFFRPPPSDPSHTYTIYVHPSTAQQIEEYAIPVIKGVLDEMVILGHSLGFTPDSVDGIPATWASDALEMTRRGQSTPQAAHKPSAMLDIEHGDPIEVEVIWGEIVRLAKEQGVSIPRTETIYGLLLIIQNQILREREQRATTPKTEKTAIPAPSPVTPATSSFLDGVASISRLISSYFFASKH
ncbi:ketopantoate reductase PanE/ApbA-domain-containing protein [Schizophyllum amplum]|uniref:Ketopantoate reductase PanE/ApbA-domain-containing protein n=1 Tax=Schizophyllum amplum TaxID=97359 RepID=A0A550CT63_9AGAR|nr:ketopantoate reductase PanE/ApbA-domain-containing protein [Auriculariopsis ampla]